MAVIATQSIGGTAGAALNLTAANAGGDTIEAADDCSLVLQTTGTGVTATLATPGTVSGLAIADNAVVLAATELRVIPLSRSLYADANGQCALTYTAVTGLKVAVIRR